MLSRRQLRIKVLQALYSFYQAGKNDLAVAERELFRSIDKVHELYVYVLLFLEELALADLNDADDLSHKFFPDQDELKAVHRFHKIEFITRLTDLATFRQAQTKSKLSWQKEQDLVRKIFLEIKKSPEYRKYLKEDNPSEKDFLADIIRKYIAQSEAMKNHIEEMNIFWSEDFDFITHIVVRTIKSFYDTGKLELMPLFKDDDDKEFARQLFLQTILHDGEFEQSISERTKNWEVERIAMMDILILKMALAELITFQNIPVKVSINEFIDISKEYSTPKSKQFVNGIIDKLAADYKEKGKIIKAGRGLVG